MNLHPINSFESVPNETINGWRILWRGWLIRGQRKRIYCYALCPRCKRIKFKRKDHLKRARQCAHCWNHKYRGNCNDRNT